jgi:hypothetical protein
MPRLEAASHFVPLDGSAEDCSACARGERVGSSFDFAYLPIVDLARREFFAREAPGARPGG